LKHRINKTLHISMEHKRWYPMQYYTRDVLSKYKLPATLPHKLGFIPKYLVKHKLEKQGIKN